MPNANTIELPIPGLCTCGSIYGCYDHGPQPREHGVPCNRCGRSTVALNTVCDRHLEEN